jgi:hypothetical protein
MPVREVKATYSSLTGRFVSRKMKRNISWESSLERDLFYLLENDPAVEIYEEQPLEIVYGKKKYTPDCMAVLKKKSFIFPYLKIGKNIIEVKYREDLFVNWKKHKPKFKEGIKKSKENDWFYKIITEQEIRGKYLDNVKRIEHHMRREAPNEYELRELMISELRKQGTCSIEILLSICFRSEKNRLMAIPVLWRMFGEESVGINLQTTINPKSEIWTMD